MSYKAILAEVQNATSLYEVLGVLPTATADEIRSAYKKRCVALHPDKHVATATSSPTTSAAAGAPATASSPTSPESPIPGRRRRTNNPGASANAQEGEEDGGLALGNNSEAEAILKGFQRVQYANDVLSDVGKKVMYDEVQHGTGIDTDDMEKSAMMMAVAKAMGGVLASLGKTANACRACPAQLAPGATGPYCAECEEHFAPKCRTCQKPVGVRGSECLSCSTKPFAKTGRCANLGCFNPTAAGSGEGAICEKCRDKPIKCKELGCFNMIKPPLVFCDKHR